MQVAAPSLRAGQRALLAVSLRLFLCSPAGLCFPRTVRCEVGVEGDEGVAEGGEGTVEVRLDGARLGV